MSRRGWIAFAALSVIWGVPYLFIKVAIDDGISPFFLSWARLVLGAGLLFALVQRQSIEMLRGGPRGWILAYATVEMVGPFPLIAAGEQHVDSSIAAIVIATVPLLIALLALRFDHTERPTRTRMLGMLIRPGRGGRTRRDPERPEQRAAGGRCCDGRGGRLRRRPHDHQAAPARVRPARHHGGKPDGCRGAAHASGPAHGSGFGPARGCAHLAGRRRRALHGGRLP
jgi:hypothetical protein